MTKTPAPAKPPISSMTGFGAAQAATATWQVAVELRSVNSRYLDIAFKLPEDARAAETALRERITARVGRGKLECKVALKPVGVPAAPQIDDAAVAQYAALYERVRAKLPQLAAPRLADVLAWPGVSTGQEEDGSAALREAILSTADAALDALLAARAREGAALGSAIGERVATIRATVAALRTRLPQVLAQQQARITERMEAALGLVAGRNGPVPAEEVRERIRQEVTMIGTRIDVAEELDRLDTHCNEVNRLLAGGGAIGKKLDFIVQEFNREANTLGSKMVAEDFQKAAIELKVLIEQMREQLQNLE